MSDKRRTTPRQVKLYGPIEDKWAGFEAVMGEKANFNWQVNVLFAQMFGISEGEIEQYKREKGNTSEGGE